MDNVYLELTPPPSGYSLSVAGGTRSQKAASDRSRDSPISASNWIL